MKAPGSVTQRILPLLRSPDLGRARVGGEDKGARKLERGGGGPAGAAARLQVVCGQAIVGAGYADVAGAVRTSCG